MKKSLTDFFEDSSPWQEEYKWLRNIVLSTGLKEELKWGKPCYTFKGSNVVLIHGFKEYCALLFHKGALLKDTAGLLVQQTKNVQSARQLRFKTLQEIKNQENTIKEYIFEAVEVEKSGLTVEMKKTADYEVPEELDAAFKKDTAFKAAFYNLTPGRQRGYLLYFSDAKQSSTRSSRIEKYKSKIQKWKGLRE